MLNLSEAVNLSRHFPANIGPLSGGISSLIIAGLKLYPPFPSFTVIFLNPSAESVRGVAIVPAAF